jgi:alpha,alpha-trehalase
MSLAERHSEATPARVDDLWVLAYDGFEPEQEGLREALCALGNGKLVTRGAIEEARADWVSYPGTYLAGGYNALPSEIAGRTVINEDLVNFPNWLPLTFRVAGGEWFHPAGMELLAYRQELHLREGLLVRRLRCRDREGRTTTVESRRLISMRSPHLAALEYRITPEDWEGELHVRSLLDGSVSNLGVARYRQLAGRHLEVLEGGAVAPEGIHLLVQTHRSHLQMALAARTRLYAGGDLMLPERRLLEEGDDRVGEEIKVPVEEGRALVVEKVVALYSSLDRGAGEPGREARLALAAAPGFEELLAKHRLAWQALWRRYDVEIEAAASGQEMRRAQLILRVHVFHLLQTVSPHTVGLDVGAPARGLHGEAYRGHIFWDDLFILPFYDYRDPEITRALLLYRYHRLPAAREAAREAGYQGAMYPWQSGTDGREATQVLHLNPLSGRWRRDWSRLQRHIGSAVFYNLWRYWRATGDRAFLQAHGAEMALEIARFWASIATWNEERERYEILGVMGPDEYHEMYPGAQEGGLANNAYTNLTAVWCLLRALDLLDEVGQGRRAELMALLDLSEEELERWRAVAARMFVPFHDGIISQFEGYQELLPFDWEAYREKYGNIERLDRILEAEGDTTDRYQVSKQADVDILFYLFDREELRDLLEGLGYPWDQSLVRRSIEHYVERTSHGSTLSKVVYASVVHHLDSEEGCRLFLEALRADVDDVQQGTTPEGIHLGAMAGTVAIVLHRYGGVTLEPDGVLFEPRLPEALARLRFRLHWRGRWLEVELTRGELELTADADRPEEVPVRVQGSWYRLEPGQRRSFRLAAQRTRE